MRRGFANAGRDRYGGAAPGYREAYSLRGWEKPLSWRPTGTATHPLADLGVTHNLHRRALEISAAFDRIEQLVKGLAEIQFAPDFSAVASARIQAELGIDVPPSVLQVRWATPLDTRALYARCVLGVFCRQVDRDFDRNVARLSDGESAQELIHRWGFHAIDITPCADGRLSGVVDYILRIPPAVIVHRKSYAGANFDVEESLRHWETVELHRWRESQPNSATENTQFLKIGVYHFSSGDPTHEGCAAHGSDTNRAAASLLERLRDLSQAVRQTHCCGATLATLLIGVDTDTDAIRMHVPDPAGDGDVARYIDNLDLYERTRSLSRDDAKNSIRATVAECAGVSVDDAATEGMRWFCGYLLKNNIGQIDAVRESHGRAYVDTGHTERLIVVGDAVDDVQLRNLAFQAQMETVEEGAVDLDIGVKVLRGLHVPQGLSVPILVHFRYEPRIPGSRARAAARAMRLKGAIEQRYPEPGAGSVFVQSVIRADCANELKPIERVGDVERAERPS